MEAPLLVKAKLLNRTGDVLAARRAEPGARLQGAGFEAFNLGLPGGEEAGVEGMLVAEEGAVDAPDDAREDTDMASEAVGLGKRPCWWRNHQPHWRVRLRWMRRYRESKTLNIAVVQR
ncbi:hypothetical protein DL770_005691 [Monosporascus sp. CRB-9-2]|nr:hypothetical protein DL770_005691 [Monosporascus sp. CRB-9-2]